MGKMVWLKRFLSFTLTSSLIFGAVSLPETAANVKADGAWEKSQDNTVVGTGVIAAPAVPVSNESDWSGSYVWYGNYAGNPVKYRVLDPETTRFSGTSGTKTMLLDCDSVLYTAMFDEDGEKNNGNNPNVWSSSDIKKGLNDGEDSFYAKSFSDSEKKAIIESSVGSHLLTDSGGSVNVTTWTKDAFVNYVALSNDKVFLLDVEDLSNNSYGYTKEIRDGSDINFRKSTC